MEIMEPKTWPYADGVETLIDLSEIEELNYGDSYSVLIAPFENDTVANLRFESGKDSLFFISGGSSKRYGPFIRKADENLYVNSYNGTGVIKLIRHNDSKIFNNSFYGEDPELKTPGITLSLLSEAGGGGSGRDATLTSALNSLDMSESGVLKIQVDNPGTVDAPGYITISDTFNFGVCLDDSDSLKGSTSDPLKVHVPAAGSINIYVWRKNLVGTPSAVLNLEGPEQNPYQINIVTGVCNFTETLIALEADNLFDFDVANPLTNKGLNPIGDIVTIGVPEGPLSFEFLSSDETGFKGRLKNYDEAGGHKILVPLVDFHRNNDNKTLIYVFRNPSSWTANKAILMGPGPGSINTANQGIGIYRTASKTFINPFIFDVWSPYPQISYGTSWKEHGEDADSIMFVRALRDGTLKGWIAESLEKDTLKYGQFGTDTGEPNASENAGDLYIGGGNVTYFSSKQDAYILAWWNNQIIPEIHLNSLQDLVMSA